MNRSQGAMPVDEFRREGDDEHAREQGDNLGGQRLSNVFVAHFHEPKPPALRPRIEQANNRPQPVESRRCDRFLQNPLRDSAPRAERQGEPDLTDGPPKARRVLSSTTACDA